MRRLVAPLLVAFLASSCGSSGSGGPPGETAAARAKREHAEAGEDEVSGEGKAWGGWRYTGSRDECFFVVGRRCFAELEPACKAARCGKDRCVTEGGGPATVRCAPKKK
jgi:hypothetical protein